MEKHGKKLEKSSFFWIFSRYFVIQFIKSQKGNFSIASQAFSLSKFFVSSQISSNGIFIIILGI